MIDDPTTWPSNGHALLRSDVDWWHNACLNYLPDHWDSYAAGYKLAGDVLVQYVESVRSRQDILVYPVAFLFRQYMELRLKELIKTGNMLLDLPGEFPKHHNLKRLWTDARRIMEKLCPEEPNEDLDAVEEFILQFSLQDPYSAAFRYPTDKGGNPSLPGVKHINIRNIAEVVDRIASFLDGATMVFDEYLQAKGEMQSGLIC